MGQTMHAMLMVHWLVHRKLLLIFFNVFQRVTEKIRQTPHPPPHCSLKFSEVLFYQLKQ